MIVKENKMLFVNKKEKEKVWFVTHNKDPSCLHGSRDISDPSCLYA